MKYKWYDRYHIVVVTSTIVSQLIFLGCPLVALENALREQYDPKVKFYGSFICHYLKEYFGFQISPEYITLALVGIVAISALIFLRRPKEQETV
jgi:energy-converting hydrogenase Eha subunit A